MRPPRCLTYWLRAPSDSSTARTRAWSPPTLAWETLRVGVVWAPGVPAALSGPAGRIGWRYLPLARFLPLRLIDLPGLTAVRNGPRSAPSPPIRRDLPTRGG